MSPSEEKVLEMVATARISAAEGEVLLGALRAPPASLVSRVLNPFEHLSPVVGGLLGVFATTGCALLSLWGVRFDGAFDAHVAVLPNLPKYIAADAFVSFPLVVVVLWACAKAVSNKVRFIDFVSVVGIARIPYLLIGLSAVAFTRALGPGQPPQIKPFAIAVLLFLLLPSLGWFFIWLFQGFRAASGAKGAQVGAAFAVSLVVAEALSKAVLMSVG